MFFASRCFFNQNLIVRLKNFSVVLHRSNSVSKSAKIMEAIENMRAQSVKIRDDPVVIKLGSDAFRAVFTCELRALANMFKKYNYELRIAGGAVRDLLLNEIPKDIDFATDATPDEMKEMFTKENIRMLNTNGEKHGTITARVNDKTNFEITTLRIDVETDGRHAEVAFTKDWMLDANRRDLTINSMFLALDGSVYDYFYGYDDLQDKKIVFVGDADKRIKEDYLRILRYFRFYGRIAENPDNHDEQTLRIISQNASGLKQISGERIWSELKKILQSKFAGELMKTMIHTGVANYFGLTKITERAKELNDLWERSEKLEMHPMTILSSLMDDVYDVLALRERLKISSFERDLGIFIVRNRDFISYPINSIETYQVKTMTFKPKSSYAKEFMIELIKYHGNEAILDEFQEWQLPKMPISGNLLREKNITQSGKMMGVVLEEVRKYWIERLFKPTEKELLAKAAQIVSEIEDKKRPSDGSY